MTTIPKPTDHLSAAIDAAHEAAQQPPRAHLGASVAGHPCERWLWLSFRWAAQPHFDGRMLRLFRRGRNEEATVIDDLRAAGVVVTADPSGQQSVSLAPHVGGSVDGVIESGISEAPKARHVLEIKTHSRKSFDALERDGVEKSKPMHWAQMQLYMLGLGIERALYYAICKDDDRIYTERVRLDKEAATWLRDRAARIALADRMPEPMPGASETWWNCKSCPAYSMCWTAQPTRHVNCRTCAHSTARDDGTWFCSVWQSEIPTDAQRIGCASHVLHPDVVPWRLDSDACTAQEAVYIIAGKPVRNGEADVYTYASVELLANPEACAALQNDPNIIAMRE